mgnify:CR=1 FL=1
MQTRIPLLLFYALLHQRLMETDTEMKILNKSEKKGGFKMITTKQIIMQRIWDLQKSCWEDKTITKDGFMFKGKRFKRVGWRLYIEQ